jgi:hypothetical protein
MGLVTIASAKKGALLMVKDVWWCQWQGRSGRILMAMVSPYQRYG